MPYWYLLHETGYSKEGDNHCIDMSTVYVMLANANINTSEHI